MSKCKSGYADFSKLRCGVNPQSQSIGIAQDTMTFCGIPIWSCNTEECGGVRSSNLGILNGPVKVRNTYTTVKGKGIGNAGTSRGARVLNVSGRLKGCSLCEVYKKTDEIKKAMNSCDDCCKELALNICGETEVCPNDPETIQQVSSLLNPTITTSSALGGNVGGNANDNDVSTFWAPSTGAIFDSPQWIQYDYGEPVCVGGYRLRWRDVDGDWSDRVSENFVLQVSNDGNNWRTVDTQGEQTEQEYEVYFATECVQYVRLWFQVGSTNPDASDTIEDRSPQIASFRNFGWTAKATKNDVRVACANWINPSTTFSEVVAGSERFIDFNFEFQIDSGLFFDPTYTSGGGSTTNDVQDIIVPQSGTASNSGIFCITHNETDSRYGYYIIDMCGESIRTPERCWNEGDKYCINGEECGATLNGESSHYTGQLPCCVCSSYSIRFINTEECARFGLRAYSFPTDYQFEPDNPITSQGSSIFQSGGHCAGYPSPFFCLCTEGPPPNDDPLEVRFELFQIDDICFPTEFQSITVDWGDGTIDTGTGLTYSHSYTYDSTPPQVNDYDGLITVVDGSGNIFEYPFDVNVVQEQCSAVEPFPGLIQWAILNFLRESDGATDSATINALRSQEYCFPSEGDVDFEYCWWIRNAYQ